MDTILLYKIYTIVHNELKILNKKKKIKLKFSKLKGNCLWQTTFLIIIIIKFKILILKIYYNNII